MPEESSSCPVPSEAKKQLRFAYPNLSDDEINQIYNELVKKEEQLGGKSKQRGGVKCGTLHYYYGIAVGLLAAGAGLGCLLSADRAKMAEHFIWVLKDMFNPRHFAHAFDIIGKLSALSLGFLERVTKFLLDFSKSPTEGGFTMNWVKNIFDIFCEVEAGKKTVEAANKEITGVVGVAVEELLKQEGLNFTVAEAIIIDHDSVVYDGKKALKILVGGTIITISPAIVPADIVPAAIVPAAIVPAAIDLKNEDEEITDDMFHDFPGGRKRRSRKIKTNRRRKTNRRSIKTKRRRQ